MGDVRKKREPSSGRTEEPPPSGAFKSSDKKKEEKLKRNGPSYIKLDMLTSTIYETRKKKQDK